jgi:preprotein translocase subunit YajC
MFLLSSDTAAAGGIGIGFTLVYIVVIVVIMYFLAIRPQKKEQKKDAYFRKEEYL